jgi:hypothetical protein
MKALPAVALFARDDFLKTSPATTIIKAAGMTPG